MGAIVDILHAGEEELNVLKDTYHDIKILKMSDTYHIIQEYRVIIPNEEEDDYYSFLLKNCMAMSSKNFLNRLRFDGNFSETMKLRSNEMVEDYLRCNFSKVSL